MIAREQLPTACTMYMHMQVRVWCCVSSKALGVLACGFLVQAIYLSILMLLNFTQGAVTEEHGEFWLVASAAIAA